MQLAKHQNRCISGMFQGAAAPKRVTYTLPPTPTCGGVYVPPFSIHNLASVAFAQRETITYPFGIGPFAAPAPTRVERLLADHG